MVVGDSPATKQKRPMTEKSNKVRLIGMLVGVFVLIVVLLVKRLR
jgi:hypothetical protein